MTIVRKDRKQFGELNPGQLFVGEMNKVCMKTNKPTEYLNTVELSTGDICHYDTETEVTIIVGRLTTYTAVDSDTLFNISLGICDEVLENEVK